MSKKSRLLKVVLIVIDIAFVAYTKRKKDKPSRLN